METKNNTTASQEISSDVTTSTSQSKVSFGEILFTMGMLGCFLVGAFVAFLEIFKNV